MPRCLALAGQLAADAGFVLFLATVTVHAVDWMQRMLTEESRRYMLIEESKHYLPREWSPMTFRPSPPVPGHPGRGGMPLSDADEAGDLVVLDLCPVAGVPVDLAVALMRAVDDELAAQGYTGIVKERTGLGRIWARPLPAADRVAEPQAAPGPAAPAGPAQGR